MCQYMMLHWLNKFATPGDTGPINFILKRQKNRKTQHFFEEFKAESLCMYVPVGDYSQNVVDYFIEVSMRNLWLVMKQSKYTYASHPTYS